MRLLAWALVVAALATAGRAGAAEAPAPIDFGKLWEEAKRWANETGSVPEDCVFDFWFDARTGALRDGYAVTCDEPFRSPFFPWPEPSRVDARFTPDDIRRHGPQFGSDVRGRAGAGGMADGALFEM